MFDRAFADFITRSEDFRHLHKDEFLGYGIFHLFYHVFYIFKLLLTIQIEEHRINFLYFKNQKLTRSRVHVA